MDVGLVASENWLKGAHGAIGDERHSYLAVACEEGDYIGNSAKAPSQFFRQHLARWLEAEVGGWDWLVFPEKERVRGMIETFSRADRRT